MCPQVVIFATSGLFKHIGLGIKKREGGGDKMRIQIIRIVVVIVITIQMILAHRI